MLKQVFLVNTDLKMTCGKTCVQIAHAETLYMESVMVDYADLVAVYQTIFSKYEQWKDGSVKPIGMMLKVVLKATEQQMNSLIDTLKERDIKHYDVYDLGYTQIKKGSFTCLCTEPLEKEIADEIFGHLKLF